MNPCPSEQSVLASIRSRAQSMPQFPAIHEPGESIFSYQQLWREMEILGERLHDAGVNFYHTVAVMTPQGALSVLSVVGVIRVCCCAPLNPKLTATEIESHLAGMQAAAIILTEEFEAAREVAAILGITVLLARVDGANITWKVERGTGSLGMDNPAWDLPLDTAVLLNTSATTGRSKLVPLSRSNLDAMFESTRNALALTEQDRLLLLTPLYHGQGIVSTFAQLMAGGTILATRGFEAASYPTWLRDLKPTWYTCAPAIHQAVVTVMESHPLQEPSSLRFVRSSGAAFTVELARNLGRVLKVPVLNGYGMSETGAVTSDALNLKPYKPGSVGRSVGPTIGIMDSHGRLLPRGEEGEIVVRGPAVMVGYANNPEANRQAFRDGWFRTGDLGRLDADGFLFVTGRSKEMINRGGQKIVPDEVDLVLAAHPAVREAVAFAVPHPTLGEDIACAVVPHPGAFISEAELRRFAGQKLAPFKVPRRIYFVEEIPRGETGKPRRHLLAERIAANREASRSAAGEFAAGNTVSGAGLPGRKSEFPIPDPEKSPTVRRLIEIWARVLKRDEFDLHEDFFTAGGDSLGAVNLLAEVDLRFGSDVQAEAASFLDDATLGNLARLLNQSPRLPSESPVASKVEVFPVREQEGRSALFCIPGDGDEGLYFRRLANHLSGRLPLSVVRPVDTWHDGSLFTFEQSAAKTAEAVQRAQPDGPYLIGGYCYGGVVAFETAHVLRKQGHEVRLVLFDVPMPGYPDGILGLSNYWERAVSELRQIRRGNGAARPAVNLRRLVRRAIWISIRPARPLLARFEKSPAVRWILAEAQRGYWPLYRPRPIDVPILHFLSIEERRPIRGASRLGWLTVARNGIEENWIPLDHDRHFRESNLPILAEALIGWCGDCVDTKAHQAPDEATAEEAMPEKAKEEQLLGV